MKLISQGVSYQQPDPRYAVYESVSYARSDGLEMIRTRYDELKDDIYDNYKIGLSADNGQTWSDAHEWSAGQEVEGGTLRWLFLQNFLVERARNRLIIMGMEGVLGSDSSLDGMTRYYPIYKVSEDGGKSWSVDEQAIQQGDEFNSAHPLRDVWVGKNALMPANAPIATADSRILVPCNVTKLGPDGHYFRPEGAFTFTAGAVMIGAWSGERLVWNFSEWVELSSEKSLRGAIEPTLAEMPDGRILMVLRANAGAVEKTGGGKWYSISDDGGMSWSSPERWTYSDGSPFYSPSSISILFRHSNGVTYWFGNICDEPPSGNLPRYPLVVGRVNPGSLLLERDSLLVVDTKKTDDPDSLQLSNFGIYQDRLTNELVLHMTRWDGQPSGREPTDASVHIYRIDVE
jgi:hypothetical protein